MCGGGEGQSPARDNNMKDSRFKRRFMNRFKRRFMSRLKKIFIAIGEKWDEKPGWQQSAGNYGISV